MEAEEGGKRVRGEGGVRWVEEAELDANCVVPVSVEGEKTQQAGRQSGTHSL